MWPVSELDSYSSHGAGLCASTQSRSVVRVTFAAWCFLVFSLPGFQVFLQSWLLDALQGTNTSDFPYDAQQGHSRHPKWQLHWAHLSDHCSSCFQLSPQAKLLITTFLCACRCYKLIHVISKTTSSDICQAEFPASRGKSNLRETIMCLLLLLTTWKMPFCHRTSTHHSELQMICFKAHLPSSPGHVPCSELSLAMVGPNQYFRLKLAPFKAQFCSRGLIQSGSSLAAPELSAEKCTPSTYKSDGGKVSQKRLMIPVTISNNLLQCN